MLIIRKRRSREVSIMQYNPKSLMLASLVWVMVWVMFTSTAMADSSSCRTTCGGINVQYPFGIDSGCGSPEFQNVLKCQNSSTLNFVAESGTYPVQSIDYNNKTVALSDSSMTTCNGGLVTGQNFTVNSTKFSLYGNENLLLLNCVTNATLVHSSEFSCNTSAPACSAFKTCADYANTDASKLVTGCCGLTQQTNSSIDLSLLK